MSFAKKLSFVNISPVLFAFSDINIFPATSILPLFSKDFDISKSFPVTIFPLFSNLFTAILFFALKTFSFLKSLDVKKPLVNIFPLFRAFSFIDILSNVWISPLFFNSPATFKDLFVETFPLFSKFPAISKFSFVAIISSFFKLFTDIPFKATNFFELISLAVNFPFVKISPVFNTFPKIFILSIAWIFPLFFKFPFILSSLFVATIPELSKLFTVIPSFAIRLFVVLVSFAKKLPFVNISPVLFAFSDINIFPAASILPLFSKDFDIFKFFSVTIFPLFSNLFTAISFFALKIFSFLKSLDMKKPLVNIFPLFKAFSFIDILSNVWISPLFVKFPSTSILFIACTIPLLVKSFVFIPSFVYIVALFSTVPFKLICLSACIPVPSSFILSAFIDISSSEYAKSFCSYSFPLISIPLPCTLFTFIFPSAVISNLLSLDTIKASEFTPAPLSVLIILILFAYIPPNSFASIAILLVGEVVLLEPVTTFKSLATIFPLNSSAFAIIST